MNILKKTSRQFLFRYATLATFVGLVSFGTWWSFTANKSHTDVTAIPASAEIPHGAKGHTCQHCKPAHPTAVAIRKAMSSAEADGVAASFKDVTEEQWWSGIEIPYQDILPREALIAKVGDAFTVRFGDKAEINGTLTLRHTQNNGTQAFGLKLGDSGFNMHLQEFADGRVKGTMTKPKYPVAYQISGNKENYTLTRVAISQILCANWDKDKKEVSVGMLLYKGPSGSGFTRVPLFNSLPGAPFCIYLDFDGETVSGTTWNTDFNAGADIVVTPEAYSPADIERIANIVAEDFRGFNVTVTTDRSVFDSYPAGTRHMNIVTPDQDWCEDDIGFPIGGIAYLGSFNDEEPSWTFNPGVNAASMTVSHEVGHTLSLTHDGNSVDEYQSAIGNWGPIMGAPFGASVVQWSQGEYEDANNPQDDIAAIEGYLGFIADDYGSSTFAATPLPTDSEGAAAFSGVISSEQDLDVFEFQVSAGTVDISITPAGDEETHNFKARGRILDENGGVIADINDLGTTSAIISESLSFGTYFLEISAGSNGTWATGGYEAYGSIGAYNVTATAPVPTPGDTDGDGLTDDEELVLGLDPYDPDTDGDEITDRKEVYPYYIVPGTFTFQEALTDAARRGGRLATIETPERLYKLKRGILDDPHPYVVLPFNYDPTVDLASRLWIGGHDSEQDGRFRWLDPVRDWVTPANELQGPEIGSAVFGQMFSGVNELRNVVNINALTVGREVIASGIPAGTTITGINVGTRTATLSNPVGTDFTAGVGQVTVVNGGLGYTVAPTVTFNPANGATAVANISGGRVTSVTVTNTGTGFINPPLVEFTGGNGGGATANALLTKAGTASVLSITVDTPGAGYTSTPTVVIAGGDPTTPATATASINGLGAVTAVTIVNPGSGYTSQPTITLVGGGATTDATATAKMYVPQGRIYSPASSGIYSNWNTVLPGNRSNTPEGIYLDSGTAFTWGPAQFTSRFGYVLELPLTDPFLADSDADNVSDSDELFTFGTDPLNTDTDLDGVDDFEEIYVNRTEPLNPDTDADGLTDGNEASLGTDPFLLDTDSDGFGDFEEVNAIPASDPLNPNSRPSGVMPPLNEVLHTAPEPTGPSRELTISDTYAPFGTRPDTDRVSEDGSVAIRDVNGVIIWVDRLGQSVVLSETALSKTLYVSNSECIVWRNRFDPTYNARGSVSRLVIYRKDANNVVTTSPEILIPGTLMETVGVSPATYGFTLIAAETDITEPVNESIQQYQSGSNQFGPTYALREVDIWDGRVTTGYRVTFDGQVQELADRFDFVPRNSNNIEGMRIVGSGADASQFLTMTVALDFFDSPLDADPGFYKIQEYGIWATWNTDTEQLSNVPLFSLTDPVTEMGYISNQRLILETAIINPATGAASGNHNLQDIRIRDTGAITLVNTVPLAQQTSILALNTFSRAGTPAYLYTTGPLGDSISLFRFDQRLTQIGATIPLPSRITSGNAFVRNPRDASLLIRDDNGQSVWIPSVLHPLTSLVQGLGTPKVLASDYDSRPLFVSTNEAVVWRNAGAPAQLTLPDTGVVPVADISHYASNANGAIIRTPIAPPILGRFVAKVQALSLDAETEGWFITTFEKTAARTTALRTYRLRTNTTSDRDGDGLIDIEEFVLNTDANSTDTDADGITDGKEIYPFYIMPGRYTYRQAVQEAMRLGGRLAVLDSTQKLDAMRRLFKFLPANGRYWLGGSDQDGPNDAAGAREGQFRWMDVSARFFDENGLPVGTLIQNSIAPWAQGQPNNTANADGLALRNDYSWEMAPLDAQYGFIFEFKTSNPLLTDTDSDILTDLEEFQVGTNPNLADTDNEGISDVLEIRGYSWNSSTSDFVNNAQSGFRSSPLLADTDSDGITDDVEAKLHGTDPSTYDTDGDGLSDLAEISIHNSDPLRGDTDGDGFTDFDEINSSPPSNPNDPSSRPLPGQLTPVNPQMHNQIEFVRQQDDLTIPNSFSPFGNRSDYNRFGDDGSAILLDVNGALLWKDAGGAVRVIPQSEFAVPLFVSGSEAIVWRNALDPARLLGDDIPAAIAFYRIDAASGAIAAPTLLDISGYDILPTAPITTTSQAFTLVSFAHEQEEGLYTNAYIYRLTFAGNAQLISQISIPNREPRIASVNHTRGLGYGTDGSVIFSIDPTALFTSINSNELSPDQSPPLISWPFSKHRRIFWVNGSQPGPAAVVEEISASTRIANYGDGALPPRVLSTSRTRAVYQTYEGGPVKDARRNNTTGTLTADNTFPTPQEVGDFLRISTQTREGDIRWVYAISRDAESVLAYRLENTGLTLAYSALLPSGYSLDQTAVVTKINPSDGSAVISPDNVDLLWIFNNFSNSTPNALSIPNSANSRALFVERNELVTWANARDATNSSGGLNNARLHHYEQSGGILVNPRNGYANLTPKISGGFILDTAPFTPDFPLWTLTTVQKVTSTRAQFRTYRLVRYAELDSDADGIPDLLEVRIGTNAFIYDTDGDGISDGDEVYPYRIIDGNFTREEAEKHAAAMGGRLAVIPNQDDYVAAKRKFGNALQNELWLGANDITMESSWTWANGSLLNLPTWLQPSVVTSWSDYYSTYPPLRIPWSIGKPDNFNNADGLVLTRDFMFEDRSVEERRGYLFEYTRSLPTDADTDNDGLSDYNEYVTGTNPSVVNSMVGVPDLDDVSSFPPVVVPFADQGQGIASTYYGLVHNPNEGHIASIIAKVSTKGSFSYTYQGLASTIKASGRGAFNPFNGSYSGFGPSGLTDVGQVRMQYVQQTPSVWVIYGVMTTIDNRQFGFELRRAKRVALPASGLFTMVLPVTVGSSEDAPYGDGITYGSIKNGAVTMSILNPDGGRATYKGPVLDNSLLAVNALSTTGKNAALIGSINMNSTLQSINYDGTLRYYTQVTGVDQIRSVFGSRYTPPSKGRHPIGSSNLAGYNTSFELYDGDLDGVAKIGAWDAANKITIPVSPTDSGLAKFDPKTGLVSYKYTKTDLATGAQALVSGFAVALQGISEIRGFYVSGSSTGKLAVNNYIGPAPSITSITPISKMAAVAGEIYVVDIKTLGAWQISIPVGMADWVTAEIIEGGTNATNGLGNGKVRITVSPNSTNLWRSGEIGIAGVQHKIRQYYTEVR